MVTSKENQGFQFPVLQEESFLQMRSMVAKFVSSFDRFSFFRKMVEKAEIITNEDFEYIVQAERDGSPNSDLTDGDVADGTSMGLNDQEKENEKETISRNVRFNSQQDIHMIDKEIG